MLIREFGISLMWQKECLSVLAPLLFNGGLGVKAVMEVHHGGAAWHMETHGSQKAHLKFSFLVFLGVMVNLMLSTMFI